VVELALELEHVEPVVVLLAVRVGLEEFVHDFGGPVALDRACELGRLVVDRHEPD